MATVRGRNGSFVDLSIDGYQFPAIIDDKWDSNWLMVNLRASDGQRVWKVREPVVLVSEFVSLSDGLLALAAGDVRATEWDAFEPCLAVAGRCDDQKCRVDISLAHEFSPDRDPASKVSLVFSLTRDELMQFALNLAVSGRNYPERGPSSV